MLSEEVQTIASASNVTDFRASDPQLYPGYLAKRYPGGGRAYDWDEIGLASLAGSSTQDAWSATFYANPSLSGAPVLERRDSAIDFDWGNGSPDEEIPADGFSARWTRTASFEKGCYRFETVANDGVRLSIDGQLVLDDWNTKSSAARHTATLELETGDHDIVLEYFERSGKASVSLSWDYLGETQAEFEGTYWNNHQLRGKPSAKEPAKILDFDWGKESPVKGIDPTYWSARWTGTIFVDEKATWRFVTTTDRGVRLRVDGASVIDHWHGISKPMSYYHDVDLLPGDHKVMLEYYHTRGHALLSASWSKLHEERKGWSGAYYDNPDLDGKPLFTRLDETIDFDWGKGSAGGGLPVDKFSIRGTRKVSLKPGTYRIAVKTNDGARLYVDDKLLLDKWKNRTVNRKVDVGFDSKEHTIVLEYREGTGSARAQLTINAPSLSP